MQVLKGVGIKAFNALAGYIFGGNASSKKMAMTTPVFSSTDGTMDFVVSASAEQVRLQVDGTVHGSRWELLILATSLVAMHLAKELAMTARVFSSTDGVMDLCCWRSMSGAVAGG